MSTKTKKPKSNVSAVVKLDATTKTPFVTVDMAKFEEHRLPNLKFESDDALANYMTNLSTEELVVDVMLIGTQFKTFKDWFAEHAEYVYELRSRLPERGPNCIEVRRGNKVISYTWSEFCVEFFGVGSEWVRRQRLLYEGMHANPQLPEPKPKVKPNPKPDTADRMVVSKLSWETLEHKSQTLELRYAQATSELYSLIKQVKKLGNKMPENLAVYVSDLEKRCLSLFELEPKPAGGNFEKRMKELDLKAEMHAIAKAAKKETKGEAKDACEQRTEISPMGFFARLNRKPKNAHVSTPWEIWHEFGDVVTVHDRCRNRADAEMVVKKLDEAAATADSSKPNEKAAGEGL